MIRGEKKGVALTLRSAVASDRDMVYEWRNSESTRRYFFDPALVSWDTHVTWFDSVLSGEHVHLLIGEIDGESVGVLRYDVEGECAEVSVYLVPGQTGQGLGPKLLVEGAAWVRRNLVGVCRLKAHVLCDNKASLRAFEIAGFNYDFCELTCDL